MRTVCGWWGVVIASVATAAVAPALRGPEDTQTDADAQTIDDRKIARIVERDGGALLEPGGLLSAEELLEARGELAIAQLADAPAKEMTEAELYETARRGVLVVRELYKCDNCPRWHTAGGGTAFVLSADGVCVTNYHMFESRGQEHKVYPIVLTADGEVFTVKEVLAASHPDDVAIFRLGNGRKDGEEIEAGTHVFTPIPLAESAPIGTRVGLIAHPDNECYTFTTGIIARRSLAHRGINGESGEDDDVPAINVTCEYGVGSSGGPVMDMRGRAVGMVCNTHTVWSGEGRRREPQMVRRRCIPSDRIMLLLASPPPKVQD